MNVRSKSKGRLRGPCQMVHEHRMMCCRALSAFAALWLAGCTTFPDLDATQTADLAEADYPALVPIDPILAGIKPADSTAQDTRSDFDARLAGLRARSQAMRGQVLSAREKRRLEEGIR